MEVKTSFSEAGRSLELSDVCNYNGKLYTFDDRTGLGITKHNITFHLIKINTDYQDIIY
jgi:predicted sulfurtransferase